MTIITCPITGYEKAHCGPPLGDYFDITNAAFPGTYRITGSAEEMLEARPPSDKMKLASWVLTEHQLGIERPIIDSTTVLEVCAGAAMPITRRLDNLMRCLGSKLISISSNLPWKPYSIMGEPIPDYLRQEIEENATQLRVWTESIDETELDVLVAYAAHRGYVEDNKGRLSLTFDGWARLDELAAAHVPSSQGFVAMWFSQELQAAYDEGIEPAIRAAGYTPVRIDVVEHNNKIDDEIIAEIRRSRFVVADFTCGIVQGAEGIEVAIPRGGVYYEAGFAQGLGIPVIWCCRADHIDLVHFDTRQFNHITWSTHEELRERLHKRISAVLGDGPLRPA